MNTISYTIILQIFLILPILAGQLIKFPLLGNLGPTLLDFYVTFFVFFGLVKLGFKLQKPPQFIVIGFTFILVGLISLIFTPLHLNNLEYLTSSLYIVRFILYLTASWVLYSNAFVQFRKEVSSTLLLSGVGLSVLGLLQFIFFPNLQFLQPAGWDPHYFRTVSTFLDPNFSGAFFVLTLLLLISHLGGCLDRQPRVLYILFTITYLALLTTFSRSSYLMFLISGSLFAVFKKSKITFLSIIILFLILLLVFQIYTQLVANPRNIDREKSASFRLNTWQQGFTLFQKSPLLGIGYNSYRYALREYKLGPEQFINSHGASSNDSSLLHILATSGIVGLVSFLFFLHIILKEAVGKNFILASGLTGLIVHSFFANSLFYPPILVWILLISTVPKK